MTNPKNKKELICTYCKKRYLGHKDRRSKNNFCSKSCGSKFHHESKENPRIKCEICEKYFFQKHKNHVTCSKECGKEKSKIKKLEDVYRYKCNNCEKEYSVNYMKKSKINFCSRDCEFEYKNNLNRKTILCEVCEKQIRILNHENRKTCSPECKRKQQSSNNSGSGNGNYKKDLVRIKICPHCKKEFELPTPSMDLNERDVCCSKKCAMKRISSSMTKPHVSICNILDELEIKYYEIEREINGFYLDVYCNGLGIEVMGEYWHGDPRLYYKKNLNEKQIRNIAKDKRKKTSIEKALKNPILYIWENEANNEKELCLKLIEKFIKNPKSLKNKNSFNYEISPSGKLKLKNKILLSYQER